MALQLQHIATHAVLCDYVSLINWMLMAQACLATILPARERLK